MSLGTARLGTAPHHRKASGLCKSQLLLAASVDGEATDLDVKGPVRAASAFASDSLTLPRRFEWNTFGTFR